MSNTTSTKINTTEISKNKLSTQAFLTLLSVGLMMGANHISARFAFNDGLDVTTAVFTRSSITCLIVMLLIFFQNVPRVIPKEQKKYLFVVGLLITAQSSCLYAAVARMPVALALLAFNTYPLFVALLARVFYKEVIEPKVLWIMPIMLFGLGLALDVFGAASGLGMTAQWDIIGLGVIFALSASFTFSIAILITQHNTPGLDGRLRSVCTMGMVAIITLLFCLSNGGPHFPLHYSGWLGLFFLILFYGTGFTVMFTVVPRLGAVGNTSIMNVEPVCALILGWIFLDQYVSPIQCIGALIVLGGAVVLGFRKN